MIARLLARMIAYLLDSADVLLHECAQGAPVHGGQQLLGVDAQPVLQVLHLV